MTLTHRAKWITSQAPHLVAEVTMLSTEEGGRKSSAPPGWGCPCFVSVGDKIAYDGWPNLGETGLEPGSVRRLGFVFLTNEASVVLRRAGQFILWEGRVIGQATVLGSEIPLSEKG